MHAFSDMRANVRIFLNSLSHVLYKEFILPHVYMLCIFLKLGIVYIASYIAFSSIQDFTWTAGHINYNAACMHVY